MKRIVAIIALAIALAACSSVRHRAHHHAVSTPGSQAAPVALARVAAPDFDGIGPLRFGMSADQMRAAWGAPLYADRAADGMACHYLMPSHTPQPTLLFMVGEGRFGRVDVRHDAGIVAPGGGHIGLSAAQIEKLYAGRVQVSPGKYDPAAQWLTVTPAHAAGAKLVFETDASGTVTSWRIGVPPQIDYVEGCN